MKLSEAIRLGSMMHPQTFGRMRIVVGVETLATCALGAAQDAGYEFNNFRENEEEVPIQCPACATRSALLGIVTHLNDEHHWTRERIADWVETIELAEEGKAAPITRDELYARGEKELVTA